MSELYASTLKYFHLAIVEFLPQLKSLRDKTQHGQVREEIKNLIEAYEDIDSKIVVHNLNYDDPNRRFGGEPDEIKINIPEEMIKNLAMLSHRLLFSWKQKLEKLKRKEYLSDKNEEAKHKFENLIWPLEALLKSSSYVVGKYASMGPLVFPGEDSQEPNNEVYFSAGQPYAAVKVLRDILESAETAICLVDNFLHPDTIRIVEPYIAEGVSVKFLTRCAGNSNFNSFCVDIGKFQSQYPSSNIETRENSYCHDRYLIVDENNVYHFGQSFHQLGVKASQMNKVEDDAIRKRITADFENWWNTGNAI